MPSNPQLDVGGIYRISHVRHGVLVVKITAISNAVIEGTIAIKRFGFKRGELLRAKHSEINILHEIEVKP